jgi:hypothetical protein
LPKRQTVAAWVYGTSHEHARFRDGYARARELLLDFYADEIIEISKDSANDFIERDRRDGLKELAYNREHVERSKLRIDTLKWVLSKLAPKKFGDKSQIEMSGPDGGPMAVTTVLGPQTVLEVARLYSFRLQQAKDAVGEEKFLELQAEAEEGDVR